ncbi:hypothetical protein, partial [Cupriavidus sp. 8B]
WSLWQAGAAACTAAGIEGRGDPEVVRWWCNADRMTGPPTNIRFEVAAGLTDMRCGSVISCAAHQVQRAV